MTSRVASTDMLYFFLTTRYPPGPIYRNFLVPIVLLSTYNTKKYVLFIYVYLTHNSIYRPVVTILLGVEQMTLDKKNGVYWRSLR